MSEHILSLSYGKDSLACLGAIEALGWPLDRIVHAEVWATDTIPADLPPMVEFKAKADKWIRERYGIEVEHIKTKPYQHYFYQQRTSDRKDHPNSIWGFPFQQGAWCNSRCKVRPLNSATKDGIVYVGIAADETERIARHIGKPNTKLPLVEAGWTEAMCRKWCEENGMLSPIYTDSARGGCWFCHNQGVDQLRLLRKNYPEYWAFLLKWDNDSPTTFKPDGHTVHDYEERFKLEDEGLIRADDRWYWGYIKDRGIQLRMDF